MRKAKVLICAIFVFACVLFVSGCDAGFIRGEIYILDVEGYRDTMTVGESSTLTIKYENKKKEKPSCLIASDNDSVVWVSGNELIALSAGEATVYVQDVNHPEEKMSFSVVVDYNYYTEQVENVSYSGVHLETCDYIFCRENGYIHRKDGDKITEVLSEITALFSSVLEGGYLFSDISDYMHIGGKELYVFGEWGNEDIAIPNTRITVDDIKEKLNEHFPTKDGYGGEYVTATAYINQALDGERRKYAGEIKLSALPTEYEYRVSLVASFGVAECVHYRAHNVEEFVENISWNSITNFIDTHTVQNTEYELAYCTDTYVIIQKRPAQ